jgi:hypothetical protein
MKLGAVYRSAVFGAMLCGANCFIAAPVVGTDVSGSTSLPPVSPESLGAKDSVANLLVRVRGANELLYSTLQSFVCDEQIERFKGPLSAENPQHIDTVTTKVSFENGIEHYSDILQDNRPRAAISNVQGAWSEGEFGTLLQQTQILLATQPAFFRTYADVDGTPAAIFRVEISEQNSPWDLEVEHHHYRIPFRTDVWVSRATGQIIKIERVSTAIPPQVKISEMRWGVTLQAVQLDEKSWLLPKTGSYAVLYKAKDRREWNDLRFSDYHRYGSEVALRFQ